MSESDAGLAGSQARRGGQGRRRELSALWPLRPPCQSGTGRPGPQSRPEPRAPERPLTCGLAVSTPCPNQGPPCCSPWFGPWTWAVCQDRCAASVNRSSPFGIAAALTFGQEPEHSRHESPQHEATSGAAPPCGGTIRAMCVNPSSRFGIAPALTSGREPEHSRHESLRREAAPGAAPSRGGGIRAVDRQPR